MLDDAQEAVLAELRAGEDQVEIFGADGFGYGFAEHLAEVSGDGEVAAFVELLVA
jgi:hypothetical protein